MNQFEWLNENSKKFLKSGYLQEGVGAKERIREIADHSEKILRIRGFSDKFYNYMSQGFYSLASPIWANFGKERGLPISCFGSNIADNTGDIMYTLAEVGMMAKLGGGCSGYFGNLRERGAAIKNNGESSGAVHFMKPYDTLIDTVSQGSVRRGFFSPTLPIDHPDILEHLNIGTEGHPIQLLVHGVSVKDYWMEEMIAGDKEKRSIWAKVLKSRAEIGYPYILFEDTANKNTVEVYKEKKRILASNMCQEIMLPSNDLWSFVCCLSSMNLLHYDKWKDTDAVEVLTYFLDSVMEEFIKKLETYRDSSLLENKRVFMFMEKAYRFAVENRALGLGALGWHSYLQSKVLPFDSAEAMSANSEIFKFIKDKSYKASKELALLFGEPLMLRGIGRRNTTLNAVAPTTSSAFILAQVSQSIEPWWSNSYVKDIAKIKVTIDNIYLKELLESKGKDTREVWLDIRKHDGSVQHLEFLTQHEKDVFKTFAEIDQDVIIYQAANRQVHIDQGQSLNLMIHPQMPTKDVNKLYMLAWRMGIKSLYYQHSINAAQQFKQKKECSSCEG